MGLFGSLNNEVATSYTLERGMPTRGRGENRGSAAGNVPNMSLDSGRAIDLSEQFVVFQLNQESREGTISEVSATDPGLEGSDEEPDVLAVLELLSFHLAGNEDVDANSRATIRMNFGKDDSSSNKTLDTVFWALAAGIDLYDGSVGSKSDPKDITADFHQAFGNRPIEIPGGLGRLSFELVRHEEAAWWRKLLRSGTSDAARKLVSALGFPAVTIEAISIVDELLDRLDDSQPEVLFRSVPMRLALTSWARDQFTGGNNRVKMGVLSPGLCVLARGRDYGAIADSNAFYYPHYGLLVSSETSSEDLLAGRFEDPLRDVTYLVFRVRMKVTNIDPTFNF